ncbi:hypothetical protein [Amycolatopsis sp. NPDC051372]|uniref:hypothetical protein n=1 Tax=Amycolatopsis sp. NPDC051372 TaxID=3155669 RepID=UPI00341E2B37
MTSAWCSMVVSSWRAVASFGQASIGDRAEQVAGEPQLGEDVRRAVLHPAEVLGVAGGYDPCRGIAEAEDEFVGLLVEGVRVGVTAALGERTGAFVRLSWRQRLSVGATEVLVTRRRLFPPTE